MRPIVAVILGLLLLVYLGIFAVLYAATPASGVAPGQECRVIVHRAKLAGFDEEQVAGITASARWGWGAELDARVTRDGKVVLVHDDTLKRITGGTDTRRPEDMTLAELAAVPLVHGGRPLPLWAGLRAARKAGVRVMVEVKRYPLHRDAWDDHGFDYLARAITATKTTGRAFVGGVGATHFHTAYPGHRGFIRVDTNDPTTVAGVDAMTWHPGDLIQLGASHYDLALVKGLRALGHPVASRNAFTAEQVAAGHAAGLRLFQEDRGGRLRNHCQEATS